MQAFCMVVVMASILVMPISLVLWIVKKLRKKDTKKAKIVFFASVVCCVVFTMASPTNTCEHEYELVESEAATCETDGFEKYHCDLCGRDKIETIDKLEHEMVNGVCAKCGYEGAVSPEAGEQENVTEEDSHEVSDAAQMVLGQIAEDAAKQVAKNPSTVKMSIFSQGFYKDGHTYAVQSDFTCSNLMGASENHTIKVVAVSNEDESKIQPTEIYFDGELIWVKES